MENGQTEGYQSLKQINDWNYDDSIELNIDETIMSEYNLIRVPGLSLMNVQIISHAPRVFKTLMRLDGLSDFRTHINPSLNEQQIRKAIQSDGGKSGQFFFFTHDNKVILKTLLKK